MYRFASILIFIIAALSLQGCSAVRLGYNNADSLTRWWIDQYIDMPPEQDLLARERLLRLHAWHRKTQLPDYVSMTRQAQKLVSGQPTASEVLSLLDEISRLGMALAEQAAPDIADFLLTVSPGQIEHMAGQFDEKNAAFAKEIQLTDGEGGQRKAQLRRVLERAKYWFAEFSNEQQTTLRQTIEQQAIGTQFWYDERLRRQREWLELVHQIRRDRPPRESIIQRLNQYAARFDMPRDPARLIQAQALRGNSAELFIAIHAMATPEQRSHAQHKLGDLINDFTVLSQQE